MESHKKMRKKMKNNDAASNSIAMGSILRWIRHWLNGRNGERNKKKNVLLHHRQPTTTTTTKYT